MISLKVILKSSSYFLFEDWLDKVYRGSRIYKGIQIFLKRVRDNSKNSFLGQISNMTDADYRIVVDSSRFVNWVSGVYDKMRHAVVQWLNASLIFRYIRALAKLLPILSVKKAGFILIIASVSNVFFTALFNKEITAWGWVMRLALLFLGISCAFCNAAWEDIKKTSIAIKFTHWLANISCKILNLA